MSSFGLIDVWSFSSLIESFDWVKQNEREELNFHIPVAKVPKVLLIDGKTWKSQDSG